MSISLCRLAKLIGFVLVFSLWAGAGHALEPIDVSQGLPGLSVAGKAEFLEDQSRHFTEPTPGLVSRDWKPLVRREIEQGLSKSDFWIRFRLVNTGPTSIPWIISHDFGLLDEMHVFIPGPHGYRHALATDQVPFAQGRSYAHPQLNLEFDLPPKSDMTVYVKLANRFVEQSSLSVRLWDRESFAEFQDEYKIRNTLPFGFAFGILIVLSAISIALRQISPVFYVSFVVFCIISMGGFSGFLFQYIYPQHPFIHDKLVLVSVLIAAASSHFFCTSYLRLSAEGFLKLHVCLVFFCLMLLGFAVAAPFTTDNGPIISANMMVFPLFFVNALAGVVVWHKTRRPYVFWFMLTWILNATCLSSFALLAVFGFDGLTLSHVRDTYEIILVCDTAFLSISFISLIQDRQRRTASIGKTDLAGAHELMADIQWHRSSRRHGEAVLHVLNVENFPSILEIYGTDGGEQVMAHLSGILRQLLPRWARPYRVAHDEMVVLTPSHHSETADALMAEVERRFLRETTDFQNLNISHRLIVRRTMVGRDDAGDTPLPLVTTSPTTSFG